MEPIVFAASPSLSLGVELEFQVLSGRTRDLTPLAGRIMADTAPHLKPRLAEEFLQSILEVRTGICASVAEAAADLTTTIRAVEEAASRHGCTLYAASLHPFADPDNQVLSFDERYHRIMKELQYVGRQFICQGLHVHVGIADRETAIRVCDTIQAYLPILLALSCSSPFFRGEDTGFASYRTKLFEVLPQAGLTCYHGSWQGFVDGIDTLVGHQVIRELRDLWWDVRPSPFFGTVEVRICDLPSRFGHVLALTALIQALVAALTEELVAPAQISLQMLNFNKWQASRHGLQARFADPLGLFDYQTLPMTKAVEKMLLRLEPWLIRLEGAEFAGQVQDILDHGTSCDRQRRLAGDSGRYSDMIDRLQEEFWS